MTLPVDVRSLEAIFNDPNRRLLIITHKDPDFDAIGSSLALYLQLKTLGREVQIWCADKLDLMYHILPSWTAIRSEIPDHFDTVIALDCSHLNRVREIGKINRKDITLINIDHHSDNDRFGDINFVEHISSVGEYLYFIFQGLGWPLNPDVASCLYAAIIFDTGRFLYSSVTPQTFEAAARLLEAGAHAYDLSEHIFENLSPKAFEIIKIALDRMVVNPSLGYAYTVIPVSAPHVSFKVIDFIRQLGTVPVFFVIQEYENGEIKVNLRSKNDFNVSEFAALFGGGGHKNASGITLRGNLKEIEEKIVRKLDERLSAGL